MDDEVVLELSFAEWKCYNIRPTSVPKVHFNARDCTPLATCLEKHGLCVFPYVRKGVHERALHQRAELVLCVAPHNECAIDDKVVLELSFAEWNARSQPPPGGCTRR